MRIIYWLLATTALIVSTFAQTPDGTRKAWMDSAWVDNGGAFQDLENWTKSKLRYKNQAALQLSGADSTGTIVYMEEIVSGSGLGGGFYVLIDSTFSESYSGAVYNSATPGKQWVLLSYYRTRTDVSVRDFGALGDKSTNDATAIQNAENFLASAGGGRLFWPKGSYYLQSTITKHPEVEWIGLKGRKTSNPSALDEKMKPHIYWDGADADTMLIVGKGVNLGNMQYLRFENLRFIGTTGAPDTADYLIYVDTTAADNTYDFGSGFSWCEFSAYRQAAWVHNGFLTHGVFQNCRWDLGPGSGIETRNGGFLVVDNFYVDTGGPTAPSGRPWFRHVTDTSQAVTQSIIRAHFVNGKIEAHRPGQAAFDSSFMYFQQDPDFPTRSFAHVQMLNVIMAAAPDVEDPPYLIGASDGGIEYVAATFMNCAWEAGRWVAGHPSFMTGTGSFQSGRNVSPLSIWAPRAAVPGEGPTANQVGVVTFDTRVNVEQLTIKGDALPTYKQADQIVILNNNTGDVDSLAIYDGSSWRYLKESIVGAATWALGDLADTVVNTRIRSNYRAQVTFYGSAPDTTWFVVVKEDTLIVDYAGSKTAAGNRTYYYEIKP